MAKMEDLVPLIKEVIETNEFILKINGTSMKPFLCSDDSVVLTKIDSLKKNDIILYQRNDSSYVLHRIYRVDDNSYTLIGDHQTKLEKNVLAENVIAKATGYIKKGKRYELKGFKYKLYLLIYRPLWLRRILLKVRG